MKRLVGMLPVIIMSVYFTVGNITGFRLPVMKGLTVLGFALLAVILYLRRSGLSAIDRGFLIFLAFNTVVFWFFPPLSRKIIAESNVGILSLALFAVTALPALFGKRYFTDYFAKKKTPAAVWETEIFKTINRHMTWVWAALFAVSGLVAILPARFLPAGGPLGNLLFSMVIPTLLMVGIGIPFNKRYPRYYQQKSGLDPVGTAAGSRAGGSATLGQVMNERQQEEKVSEQLGQVMNEQQQEEKMSGQLRVTAINGSPHGAVGNTSQMIRMVGEGLAREGIVLEEIRLTEREIAYCIGCAVCLEKGVCWRRDDYAGITEALFAADGIILASPVYFKHVTAQMKTFLDRSLAFGHKLRRVTKPGLAITVSAGLADTATAHYLEGMLRMYGAYPLNSLVAIATNPGGFLGKETVEARAQDLARELARAIKEKKRYPVTGDDLGFYLFMRDLVTREKAFMRDDYEYWQKLGLFEGFEAYAWQNYTIPPYDPVLRNEWIKGLIKGEAGREKGSKTIPAAAAAPDGPAAARSCHELLTMMPRGFRGDAVPGLEAVYQFDISGTETFNAYLEIADGHCTFREGSHSKPGVVIKAPAEVWLAIARGEMDGQGAFMEGKYRVEGNLGLLLKLKVLFST